MLDSKFVFVGILVSSYGMFFYIRDTLRGKTQPNRVAWSLLALAPLVAFIGEVDEGVGLRSASTLWFGIGPVMIVLASFVNKNSYWKITKFNYVCGGLSLLALVLWSITKTGNIAILFGILADGLAGVPILVKAFRAPKSETSITFLLGGVNAFIALLTVTTLTFANVAFPVYIILFNTTIVLIIKKFHKSTVFVEPAKA